MIVRINGKVLEPEAVPQLPLAPTVEAVYEKRVSNFFKYLAVPVSAAAGLIVVLKEAFAEHAPEAVEVFAAFAAKAGGHVSIASRMMPLIHMVQEAALPLGIVVSSWGLIEIIMGNVPSGKEKLKWSIMGFVGMFVIPEVFYAIRDAFGR